MKKKISFVMLLFCGGLVQAGELVQAVWTQQALRYTGYSACATLHDAAYSVLDAVEARDVRIWCSYTSADLQFSSLQEKTTQSYPPSVEGVWLPTELTYNRNGPECSELSDALDWLLSHLAVRNVQYSVFCQGGTGYLHYAFEALIPMPHFEQH